MQNLKHRFVEYLCDHYPFNFVLGFVIIVIGSCFPFYSPAYFSLCILGVLIMLLGFVGITIVNRVNAKNIKEWYERHPTVKPAEYNPRAGYVVDGPTTHQQPQDFGRVTLRMLVGEAKSKGNGSIRLNTSDFTIAPGALFDIVRDYCNDEGHEFKPDQKGVTIVFR